jgi:hypothetical protein
MNNDMFKIITFTIAFMLLCITTDAQILDISTGMEVMIDEGLSIQCFKKTTDSVYYYIPTHVHFETLSNGEKSYSILNYKNENDQIEGGIMHWMLQWGLNSELLKEANDSITKYLGPNVVLRDAITVEWIKGKENIEIIGENELGKLIKEGLVNASKVPLNPYSKSAMAFKWNADQASKIDQYWHDETLMKNVFVKMSFQINLKNENRKISVYEIEIQSSLFDMLK